MYVKKLSDPIQRTWKRKYPQGCVCDGGGEVIQVKLSWGFDNYPVNEGEAVLVQFEN